MIDINDFRPSMDYVGHLDVFDAVEVHPCKEDDDHNVEQCDPAEATMWSVYLHCNPEHNGGHGGLECVADFKTEAQANILGEALDKILALILPAGEHIPMR